MPPKGWVFNATEPSASRCCLRPLVRCALAAEGQTSVLAVDGAHLDKLGRVAARLTTTRAGYIGQAAWQRAGREPNSLAFQAWRKGRESVKRPIPRLSSFRPPSTRSPFHLVVFSLHLRVLRDTYRLLSPTDRDPHARLPLRPHHLPLRRITPALVEPPCSTVSPNLLPQSLLLKLQHVSSYGKKG